MWFFEVMIIFLILNKFTNFNIKNMGGKYSSELQCNVKKKCIFN